MRPDDRAVDAKPPPIDPALGDPTGLQAGKDLVPHALTGPLAEAIVDGLPGPELGGEVAPTSAVGEDPEDSIDDGARVFPLSAASSVGGESVPDLLPLGVGQAVGRGCGRHGGRSGRQVTREAVSLCSKSCSHSTDTA